MKHFIIKAVHNTLPTTFAYWGNGEWVRPSRIGDAMRFDREKSAVKTIDLIYRLPGFSICVVEGP